MIKPANGSNGHHAPPWAKELSADVRASLQSAAADRTLFQAQLAESNRKAEEDRKRAEEDRKQAAADRRRYAEDSARRHKEFMGALQVIGRVAVQMQREQKNHTQLLNENTQILHEHTQILRDIARSLHVRGNGRGGGNGRRRVP